MNLKQSYDSGDRTLSTAIAILKELNNLAKCFIHHLYKSSEKESLNFKLDLQRQ